MQHFTITIKHLQGIHLKPATKIINILKKYPNTKIEIKKETEKIEATSIINILSLNLSYQKEVTLYIEGEEEEKCSQELKKIFQDT